MLDKEEKGEKAQLQVRFAHYLHMNYFWVSYGDHIVPISRITNQDTYYAFHSCKIQLDGAFWWTTI